MRTGIGFDSISDSFGQPGVVVNCAALSVPRACEANPDAAMSVNVPTSLLAWMSTFRGYSTCLIKKVSASSVDHGVKSPADISMDISKLVETLKFFSRPF